MQFILLLIFNYLNNNTNWAIYAAKGNMPAQKSDSPSTSFKTVTKAKQTQPFTGAYINYSENPKPCTSSDKNYPVQYPTDFSQDTETFASDSDSEIGRQNLSHGSQNDRKEAFLPAKNGAIIDHSTNPKPCTSSDKNYLVRYPTDFLKDAETGASYSGLKRGGQNSSHYLQNGRKEAFLPAKNGAGTLSIARNDDANGINPQYDSCETQ